MENFALVDTIEYLHLLISPFLNLKAQFPDFLVIFHKRILKVDTIFPFRDAEDAVRGRDGYEIGRTRIRVEFPKQGRDSRGGGFWGGRGRGGFGGRGRGRGAGPPRRSDYRVLVSGLPQSGSWQDLKDHMREAGDVVYTDVFRDGTGVVEFARKDDMKWAVKNLNDSKFKSHEVNSVMN